MYLQRRSNGRYYFRMGVPVAYRSAVGKSEICFSLNTTDKKEARLKSLPFIEKYLLEFNAGCPTMERKSRTVQIRRGIAFSKVYEKYLNERKISISSKLSFDTAVDRFIRIIGDKDIRLYEKKDISDFKDVLLQYPIKISDDDKLLSVDKLIQKHKNSKKMSLKTITGSYLGLIKAIFQYAVINDMRAENPCMYVRIVARDDREVKRLPFTVEQIRQNILGSDLFHHKQDDRKTEYKFLILLGIFTGARLEELVRLRRDDVGAEDGVAFIFIQPHTEEGHLLKTASSRRRVPLHPRLMDDWKFGEYIERIKQDNSKYLFPVVNTGKVIAGKKGTQFSKWFARWLDKVGLNSPGLCFHSFRHTLKNWGRGNGVDIPLLNALQGHHNGGVSFSYGVDAYGSAYPLKTLYDGLVRIEELGALRT